MDKLIQAGKFKAQCLKIMEEVKATSGEVIVTKHCIPIVKLCPLQQSDITLFGKMAGTIHIKENIILSIEEDWDANR